MKESTICAIATSSGQGAISIVRVSGPLAIKNVNNLVDINALQSFGSGNVDGAVKKLYDTKIMLGTEKTLYDVIYDLVATDSFSKYQSDVIKTQKNDTNIIYNEQYYKDLY